MSYFFTDYFYKIDFNQGQLIWLIISSLLMMVVPPIVSAVYLFMRDRREGELAIVTPIGPSAKIKQENVKEDQKKAA